METKRTPTLPTTPEEEGIELHPDAWERFERTVDKVVKGGRPATRTRKPAGAGQARKPSGLAKLSG
jgi:hypothetical protein